MATKYLDYAGLQTVWAKVKSNDATVLSSAKSYADGLIATEVANRNAKVNGLQAAITSGAITAAKATAATSAITAAADADGNNITTTYLKASTRGATNGVASLGSDGKIPASQLPSYVDDVIEGYYKNGKFYKESGATTEITGETGKIYVDLNTNVTYRYTGNTSAPYCEISSSLAIGETSSTAYSGASGKQNRTDINTLLGYFTNGIANKAKVLTDGTTQYTVADFSSYKSILSNINSNYVKQSTSSDSRSSRIYAQASSLNLGTYDSANPGTDSEILGQLYIESSETMLTGYDATYIGYQSLNGKANSWSDHTFIYGNEKVEIEGDGAIITLEGAKVSLTCASGLYLNGISLPTIIANNVDSKVTAITSAELAALLV